MGWRKSGRRNLKVVPRTGTRKVWMEELEKGEINDIGLCRIEECGEIDVLLGIIRSRHLGCV